MTIANESPAIGIQPPAGNANQRSRFDFDRAHRHSKLVGILKRALPATAIGIVFLFVIIVGSSLSPIGNFALELSAFKDGKVVMNEPKLSGFDAKNRPFNLIATRAVQDLSKPGMIFLENIDATVPMDEKAYADINALAGVYQTKEEILELDRKIVISGARGMDITLQSAHIDINQGILTSNQAINIRSKETQLEADSVRVEDNGRRIVFKDNVRMTINQLARSE